MIKLPFTISGNGSSLWGQSKGRYLITSISVEGDNVEFFGPKTKWSQYTDNRIEKEINNPKIIELIKKKMGVSGDWYLSWSEQGMQPTDGWNFDFCKKD